MARMRWRRSRVPMVVGVAAFFVVLLTAYGDGRTSMDLLVNSAVIGLIAYGGSFLLLRRRRRR